MAGIAEQKLSDFEILGTKHKPQYLHNHLQECSHEALWLNYPIRSDQRILPLPEQRQLISLQNLRAEEMQEPEQKEEGYDHLYQEDNMF